MPVIRIGTRSRGFTLLEVLIALLILAIGLLGMASLMLASIQSNQGASQRSAAVVLSYDLVERMRSNRDQTVNQDPSPYEDDPAVAALPVSECYLPDAADGCTAEEIAEYDLAVWWAAVQDAIPGSEMVIQRLTETDYCIAIFWESAGRAIIEDDDPRTPCGEPVAGREFYSVVVTL
jgi:type IV pilus assembly protein PilV